PSPQTTANECLSMTIEPSPSGRGREARARQGEASREGEGLKICSLLLPSPSLEASPCRARAPRASRHPPPEGEELAPTDVFRTLQTTPLNFATVPGHGLNARTRL